MATAGIYSAKNTTCTFGGVPALGLASDNAYTLSYKEDGYTITEGLDGFITASQTSTEVMEVTIRLMHTSSYNNVLQAFYTSQRVNPITAFRSFFFKDLLGTLSVTSDQSLIIKPADIVTSKDVPEREWKIAVMNPIVVGGGSIASPFVLPI